MSRTAHRRGDDYILSPTDLVRLTGKEHADAQRAELRRMGITFGERLDGTPVVTRDAVRAYTGERSANDADKPSINLKALHGSQAKGR